jgi:hypothetical protein
VKACNYPNPAQKQWISLDYSLQLSMSLTQWMQWKAAEAAQTPGKRQFVKALRRTQ